MSSTSSIARYWMDTPSPGQIRHGSRKAGERFSITEAAKARPSKGGGGSGDMLPRKNVLNFNPLKCHSLGLENLLIFLKSNPFFKSLTVLRKTVETGLDPRLQM